MEQTKEIEMNLLSNVLPELKSLMKTAKESILLIDDANSFPMDPEPLLVTLTALEMKLEYYCTKYNFRVPQDDRFYSGDFPEFVEKYIELKKAA